MRVSRRFGFEHGDMSPIYIIIKGVHPRSAAACCCFKTHDSEVEVLQPSRIVASVSDFSPGPCCLERIVEKMWLGFATL